MQADESAPAEFPNKLRDRDLRLSGLQLMRGGERRDDPPQAALTVDHVPHGGAQRVQLEFPITRAGRFFPKKSR